MSESWMVLQTAGQRIDLERGLERKEVKRPKEPTALQIFLSIRPGELSTTVYSGPFLA